MFLWKPPVVASAVTLFVLVAAYALWVFFPLMAFQRGAPVFYRSDALRQVNRGAAATVILGGTLIDVSTAVLQLKTPPS